MNISEIVRLYEVELLSLRAIWKLFWTDNHRIKRILLKEWVQLNHNNRKKYIMTNEHKRKIWEKSKWRQTTLWIKQSEQTRRKNMIWHLKRGLTLKDIAKYDDIEKLTFLNNVIWRHRKHFMEDKKYIAYLDKFFFNNLFNTLYKQWIDSWKCKWIIPSLEHILPISRWWTFDLDNLTFTTWFENRAKAEMTLNEWYLFKVDTGTESNLFYL